MRKLSAGLIALVGVGVMAGCTTNNTVGNPQFTTQAKLTIAVGTLNDNFATLTGGGQFLNVVSAFRNQFGNSAFIKPGTPTLTGPGGAITIATGACDQLFGYGQLVGCNNIAGMAPAYAPPDATHPTYQYPTGFVLTGAAVAPGAYAMSTVVNVNGTNLTFNASATLPAAPVVLGNDAGVVSFASDGKGGGTFTLAAAPAGVTESVVEVLDSNAPPNQVASGMASAGSVTITGTGNCAGTPPLGVPIPCGAFNAFVIGADYPFVEAGPPTSKVAAPTLTGAGGSADLTVGPLQNFTE